MSIDRLVELKGLLDKLVVECKNLNDEERAVKTRSIVKLSREYFRLSGSHYNFYNGGIKRERY